MQKHVYVLLLVLGLSLLAQERAATVKHQAVLNYQSTACTSANPCQLSVYRTTCRTPTTCPSYGNGRGWTMINYGVASAKPTATGTQWVVVDQDPNLQDATTYVYVAKLAWKSGANQQSAPGPAWSGTTSAGVKVPATPTNGTGNVVN